ncbi:flagellar protein FliT [Bacillus thermophilus]|uniref:Flagellar protein FliT n=1 Tax=Siminovitchia thermophila TaxID=1245522 RepID=A0ABS2R3I1_9BACI|nr:hypothetical protein [Siminovitchia thermophila]MBM7714206.1 flagellar protein FliT [Siminovitchia thermophila]ONK23378.1 hypothetical protein BLX87_10955 [Bacillus sp. VT-16-64]
MSAVQECLRLTEELLVILRHPNSTERDRLIHKIEETLTRRENLLPQIKPPFSEEDLIAGKKLVDLNNELSFLLESVNSHILRELNELELKKTSASRYANPYGSASQLDGAFYDKRL